MHGQISEYTIFINFSDGHYAAYTYTWSERHFTEPKLEIIQLGEAKNTCFIQEQCTYLSDITVSKPDDITPGELSHIFLTMVRFTIRNNPHCTVTQT